LFPASFVWGSCFSRASPLLPLLLLRRISLSHSHHHPHSHSRSRSRSHSHSPPPPLTPTLAPTVTLTFSLSHSHPLTLSLSVSHSVTFSLSHFHSLSLSLPPPLLYSSAVSSGIIRVRSFPNISNAFSYVPALLYIWPCGEFRDYPGVPIS
jgi:hypothetical protein